MVRSQSLPNRQATPNPDEPLRYPFGSSVGKPASMMVWSDDFLTAPTPTADILAPRGDWMAPISAQGVGVGTITVFQADDGSIQPMWDDNAEVASALMAARPKDTVVSDGLNGVFILTDNTARQYGLRKKGIGGVGTLSQLQAALVA